MRRKAQRIPVSHDAGDVEQLSADEIAFILRGADDLIMRGGRTLLTKLLKGSREKRLPELELDQSPAYGKLNNLTKDEILARIDWLILNGYLAIVPPMQPLRSYERHHETCGLTIELQ